MQKSFHLWNLRAQLISWLRSNNRYKINKKDKPRLISLHILHRSSNEKYRASWMRDERTTICRHHRLFWLDWGLWLATSHHLLLPWPPHREAGNSKSMKISSSMHWLKLLFFKVILMKILWNLFKTETQFYVLIEIVSIF